VTRCRSCTRRTALALAVTGLAWPAVASAKCTEKGLDVGPLKAWPKGTFRLVETDVGRFVVAHDERGLYCYSGMCTHMGGAIVVDAQGTGLCPAHQSMFGPNGEVTRGPATRPLPHFAVKPCGERLLVDPLTIVAPDVRMPV